MIRSLTSFATRRRWLTIIVWTLLGAALTVVGQSMMFSATDSQAGDFLPKGYDSAAALKIAEDEFDAKPDGNAATVLVARTDGKKLTVQDRKKISEVAAELGERRVIGPKPEMPLMKDHSQTPRLGVGSMAPDGTFQLLSFSVTGNMNDPGLQEIYREFRDTAEEEFTDQGMRVGFTGGIASTADTVEAGEFREKIIGVLTMGLIVVLNVLVFRSVLAALLPLIAVSLIGGVAAGAVAGSAELFDIKLDASTPSLITVVLLGIGIDYFLFLLFRFREQLRTHPEQDAVTAAAATAGRVGNAILSAGLTIVAAFATLGVASFGQFRVLGPAIAISVLVMLLASLTLMPALLAVSGRAMFWPSKAWKKERHGGVSARLGLEIARRPVRYLLGSLALLGVLTAGVVGVKMSYDPAGLPETDSVKVAAEISRSLPAGATDPHTVYVRSESGTLRQDALSGLTGSLAEVEGVGQVAPPTLNADRTAARFDVVLSVKSDTQQARDLVSGPVRSAIDKNTPENTEAHITGTAAVFADIATAVEKDLKLVFPIAAALIALILLLLLRSVLAPLVLMIAVGLGFAATLGAGTLAFQHLLDRPGISFTLPLVLFLFVVALGTDYNILISDRIREEMDKPVPVRHAVAEAVRHTAPAIATAGLVLAGSFASLVANPATQEVGFATALGIVLSSFVLSIVLVPAVAVLLGRGLWWPRRPARTVGRHGSDHIPQSPQAPQYTAPQYTAPHYTAPEFYDDHPVHPQGR